MSNQCEIKQKYVLTYFNLKALGEPIRLLLSYGRIDFVDKRIEKEDWPSVKATMPNGQMPILQIGNKTMFQSLAICRYLARKVGLNGSNDWEDAEIDMAVYTLTDLRLKVATVFYEPNESVKESKYVQLMAETIPFHLKTLEGLAASNNGYLALKKLTWADFLLAGLVDYLNVICRQDITANSPNLKKVVQNVRSLPAVKEWLAKAPKTEL